MALAGRLNPVSWLTPHRYHKVLGRRRGRRLPLRPRDQGKVGEHALHALACEWARYTTERVCQRDDSATAALPALMPGAALDARGGDHVPHPLMSQQHGE